MTRLTSLAFGVGLALASIGFAQAQTPSGVWKLSVGVDDPPCSLNLAQGATSDSGPITATGSDCPTGLYAVTDWRTSPAGVDFYSGDELVATLKAKGDGYVGKRIADGRKMELTH